MSTHPDPKNWLVCPACNHHRTLDYCVICHWKTLEAAAALISLPSRANV